MYDIVTLGRKDNALEPENHIATLMSNAVDLCPFNPKFPWVDHGDSSWKG